MTIREVAQAAGVSVTTVSQSLNDPVGSRVAPSTREHVRAVAARLGYRASVAARALRTSRTDTVALVGHDLVTTEFLGNMIRGAQEEVRSRGGLLIVADTGEDGEGVVRALLDHQVDGALLGAYYHQRLVVPEALRRVPTVLVNAFTDDPSYSSVVPDERSGGRMAAEVLIAAGHRQVAMINNHDEIPAAHGRRAGFLARCRDSNLDAEVVQCAPTAAAARQAALRLLAGDGQGPRARSGDGRPTGVFVFSDVMVIGVYQAAQSLGLRIPEDLSVVGFDDMRLIDDSLHPRVTSVALPHAQMAAWAVQELYRLLENGSAAGDPRPGRVAGDGRQHSGGTRAHGEPVAVNMSLAGQVIERESVAPPPAP